MTEPSDPLPESVNWSVRLAAVGLGLATLTVVVASVGPTLPGLLYWSGITLSIGGVVGAAAYGSSGSSYQYGAGVVAAVVGVLVVAYGVESGTLSTTVVGVVVTALGVAGVLLDTRGVS
jgi:hypothetical protein